MMTYLPVSRKITQFTTEAIYGKSNTVIRLVELNKIYLRFFSILFLIEIIITFMVTFLIYRRSGQELYIAKKELNQLAQYDSLTGLYNRRMLENFIEHGLVQAE